MEMKHLVSIKELKTTLLKSFTQESRTPVFVDYDKDFDALFLRIVPLDKETVAHYVDEHVALLYEADSYEIVGLQIENFELSFVPKHDAVRRVWKLSESGIALTDLGDMIFEIETRKPEVAREVVKATQDVLGEPGPELVAAFA